MKVVFVNRFFFPDYSATSQILTDLAFFLVDGGARVCVVTSRQGYENAAPGLPHKELVRGVHVYRVWSTRLGRGHLVGRLLDYMTFYVSASWQLLRLVIRGDVVVAKTDPPLMGVAASLICRAKRAALINWLQDLFPEVAEAAGIRGARTRAGRWLRALRNHSITKSSATAVIGERMRKKLVSQGISPEQLVVIPNWADGAAVQPLPKSDNQLIAAWGLTDKLVVAYSGNLGRVHELATIVDAMDLLRSEERIEFLFIGGGKRRDWLETEARKREIANVQFRPYQPRERLSLSLGVADIHLVTLLPEMEGLIVPSKFYGVAAAGKPTIFVGDPDGEIAQVVSDYACGIVVPSGDARALVGAILRLRDDHELAERCGRNARTLFDARFAKTLGLQRWKALIERVASPLDLG